MRHHARKALAVIASLTIGVTGICHAQTLETETARFLERGHLELGTGFEFQTSREGTERAVPIAAEYGLTRRLSLLVEPVAYTAIRPKRGPGATGAGDLEVTAFLLAQSEERRSPALALAGEVKIPTTHNVLIGTGKTDVTGYLIGSKHLGRLDAHANVGYTALGKPAGAKINNIWSGAVAVEYPLGSRFGLYGEVLGNTSSSPESGDTPGPSSVVVAEAAGGELVGTMGVSMRPMAGLLLSLGVSYDNNNALQIRPGVTFWTR